MDTDIITTVTLTPIKNKVLRQLTFILIALI